MACAVRASSKVAPDNKGPSQMDMLRNELSMERIKARLCQEQLAEQTADHRSLCQAMETLQHMTEELQNQLAAARRELEDGRALGRVTPPLDATTQTKEPPPPLPHDQQGVWEALMLLLRDKNRRLRAGTLASMPPTLAQQLPLVPAVRLPSWRAMGSLAVFWDVRAHVTCVRRRLQDACASFVARLLLLGAYHLYPGE